MRTGALAEMRRLDVFNRQKTMPPPPRFFLSADSKELRFSVSCLESIVADDSASVDSKKLTRAHNSRLEPDGSTDIGDAIDGDLTSVAHTGKRRRASPGATFFRVRVRFGLARKLRQVQTKWAALK